jgi:hypothetical protein
MSEIPPNNDLPPAELFHDFRDDWSIRREEGGKKIAIRYPERKAPPFLMADTWDELREVLDAWTAGHP